MNPLAAYAGAQLENMQSPHSLPTFFSPTSFLHGMTTQEARGLVKCILYVTWVQSQHLNLSLQEIQCRQIF